MTMQARSNISLYPFIRKSDLDPIEIEATIAQDAARVAALTENTVMAKNPSTSKWVPLTSIDPTLVPAKLTCGAFGSDEVTMAAISDGEFNITVDGVSIDITGIDFSVLDSLLDTPATLVCGANGGNLAAYQAVTDGSFRFTVNGVQRDVTTLDWSLITALDEVVDPINVITRPWGVLAEYDSDADVVSFTNIHKGATSTITVLSAAGAGTDVSGAGFLNGLTGTGTATQGTGGSGYEITMVDLINAKAAGRFLCEFDGSAFVFFSPTVRQGSAMGYLAAVSGGAGTDISGASYLNGLTGTGTIAVYSGGDGTDIPMGIYVGADITAAELVAGDVVNRPMLIRGANTIYNSDLLVLENSLALTDIVISKGKQIGDCLIELGFIADTVFDAMAYENA